MSREGPIIVVDGDRDGWFLIKTALSEIGIKNKMMFFQNGSEAFEYISQTTDNPFMVLCDVDIPVVSGPELVRRIREHHDSKKKSVPFIFLCNEVSGKTDCACEGIQGFFMRPNTFEEIKFQLNLIVSYWRNCRESFFIQ